MLNIKLKYEFKYNPMNGNEMLEETARRFNFMVNYNPAKPESYKTLREAKDDDETILFEGINIDKFNKKVEYDDSHERGVVTGNYMSVPNPVYSRTKEGYPVISIFERTAYEKYETDRDPDANPLIYAMKGINGWSFKNGEKDIYRFFRRFVQIAKGIKTKYDTIIKIPSKSNLNNIFIANVSKIIGCENIIANGFAKMFVSQVYELINYKKIQDENPTNYKNIARQVEDAVEKQDIDEMSYFSFKEIPPQFRKYIGQVFCQKERMLDLAPQINDKDILILDDTIASGTTISHMCECVLDLYIPKSITIITLFSARR